MPCCVRSVSKVTLTLFNNVWWMDAFQYGQPNDLTWDFNAKTFLLDIKLDPTATTPLLALSSLNGDIVVDDPILRILHMNVDDHIIRTGLPVNELQVPELDPYAYDLVMVDDVTGERMLLMFGWIEVCQGVTIED